MSIVKVLLLGINSKYIHSNLAIRCLKKYALTKIHENVDIEILECSINQHYKDILNEVAKKEYNLILFSTYIWNIELFCKLAKSINLIYPNTTLIAGGPEVSYETQTVLRQNTDINYVIRNEGELAFVDILKTYMKNGNIENCNNVCYINNNNYNENEENGFLDLNTLPFPYDENDFDNLENKIIYYETSRGCPYLCSYCMSSLDKVVRSCDVDIVKQHLKVFLDKNVRQVKFVDRTFNFNIKRANELWKFIIENDNGFTNFHCEIAAMLLNESALEVLKNARVGLIQFEIGIQTTNEETTKIIKRPSALPKISNVVLKLNELGNIHQHLDLIIGLPLEDYNSFKTSFNYVHNLNPEQLQVGFLKLLKGSPLFYDARLFGIVADPNPPYEILYNKYMSYSEISFLKVFEDVIEKYQNSLRYITTLTYLKTFFDTPFDFFEDFSKCYKDNGFMQNLSKDTAYKILFDYGICLGAKQDTLSTFIRFDMMRFNKVTKNINWLTPSLFSQFKNVINDIITNDETLHNILPNTTHLKSKDISKNIHIEVFAIDPLKGAKNCIESENKNCTMYLFNYTKKFDDVNYETFVINF